MHMLSEKEIRNDLMIYIDDPSFNDWFEIVKGILVNEEFQKRRLFKHHTKSVWEHSIDVSFKAYKYSFHFRADRRVCAIGGLLHDFYPYAWLYSEELNNYDPSYLERLYRHESFFHKHGFTHAREAYNNYLKYFENYKNKKVSDCIIKHMFPLNIKLPKYRESWLVSIADKISSVKDTGYIIGALLSDKRG